jgi:hypothetical protein
MAKSKKDGTLDNRCSNGGSHFTVHADIPLLDELLDEEKPQPQKFTLKEWRDLTKEEVAKHVYVIMERLGDSDENFSRILADYGFSFMRWNRLLERNPHLYSMYNKALEARAFRCVEETKAIADDGSNDIKENRYGTKYADKEVVGRSNLRIQQRWRACEFFLARRKPIFDGRLSLKDRLLSIMTKFGEGELTDGQVLNLLKIFEGEAVISEKYDIMKRVEELEKKAANK